MELIIAEKPEVAKAIAEALGGGEKKQGYYVCGNYKVTNCFGHMLRLFEPVEYDSRYKNWKMSELPMQFIPWRKKIADDKQAQYAVVANLIKEASVIIHAGDPDEEGQLIVDEVLEREGVSKPVKRVFINDNTPKIIQRELANLKDNSDFTGLGKAAEARSVADQLYGFNMSRAYTLMAEEKGYTSVLTVGRVQTPILGLVVRRDAEFEAHKKSYYYTVSGQFNFDGLEFDAKYQVAAGDPVDEKQRITSAAHAKSLEDAITGQTAKILKASISKRKDNPPLPYNLLNLQADASKKYGYDPSLVKDITQRLREQYKLITYNRSDCQYLKEERHEDAPNVFVAIGATAPMLQNMLDKTDSAIKSRAFNSAKVSAHHAIIPTESTAEFSRLKENEQNIYLLIARAYILQFLPPYQYDQLDIEISVGGKKFACSSKVTTDLGWREFASEAAKKEEDETDLDLKALKSGQEGLCYKGVSDKKETKPKPRYTTDTLLKDLPRVAEYIKDERLRKLLIDKDKGKEGEHGGIGTSATRDSIIKNLFERRYLEQSGQNIVSTKLGREFYAVLPDQAKYPDMTALWHEQQKSIETNDLTIEDFIAGLMEYISGEIARVKTEGIDVKVQYYPCTKCGKALRKKIWEEKAFWGCVGYPECKATYPDENGKPNMAEPKQGPQCECGKGTLFLRKGGKGNFWGCSSYPECKKTYPDSNGKPDLAARSQAGVSELHKCMQCGRGLRRIENKKDNTFFWGCSGYASGECKKTYPDMEGKPDYSK